MFSRTELRRSLSSIGCSESAPYRYNVQSSSPSVAWSLWLRPWGIYRHDIDVRLGYRHAGARSFVHGCLSNHGGPAWAGDVWPEDAVTGTCPVGLLAGWPDQFSFKVAAFTAVESAARLAAEIKTHAFPFVEAVVDESAYLSMLLSDTGPTQWHFSHSLARFAEIAYLSSLLGSHEQSLGATVAAQGRLMAGQLASHPVECFVKSVLHAAYRGA